MYTYYRPQITIIDLTTDSESECESETTLYSPGSNNSFLAPTDEGRGLFDGAYSSSDDDGASFLADTSEEEATIESYDEESDWYENSETSSAATANTTTTTNTVWNLRVEEAAASAKMAAADSLREFLNQQIFTMCDLVAVAAETAVRNSLKRKCESVATTEEEEVWDL
jgi:hypothetical protein